ncbi:MAG: outer membrane lipoprotein chaperone LolA [Burkholderiaceae bacterium]
MKKTLFAVALAASALAWAIPAQAAGSIDQLRAFLTQTQSARGDFTQKVSNRDGKSTQPVSSGRFEFQRPGKFRWTYVLPYEQVIVSDGAKLWLYDKDLNQVTVKKLAAALPASPASILFGSNDFEREFEVSDDGSKDGVAWIVAQPRGKDTSFQRIRIGFRDGLPAAMELQDSFGQTSRLAFAKVERNPRLETDAFRFSPPKGADVLEDR